MNVRGSLNYEYNNNTKNHNMYFYLTKFHHKTFNVFSCKKLFYNFISTKIGKLIPT